LRRHRVKTLAASAKGKKTLKVFKTFRVSWDKLEIRQLHAWDVSTEQAIAIQEHLRQQVVRQGQVGRLRLVAGVDVGFEDGGKITRAAVAVLSFPDMERVEAAVAVRPTSFPYVPGLLSFREAPAILEALSGLNSTPDLLVCDGHGIAHPRRLGIASHLGLLTGLPSIGVAKSILIGRHAPLGEQRGAWQPLVDQDEIVGAALRTRPGVKPVYVSIGHHLSLETAIELVLCCTGKFRLPEPLRQAHQVASG
jgi:deoxyribonuclease V